MTEIDIQPLRDWASSVPSILGEEAILAIGAALEELDKKLGEYQVLLSDVEHRVSVNEVRLEELDRRTTEQHDCLTGAIAMMQAFQDKLKEIDHDLNADTTPEPAPELSLIERACRVIHPNHEGLYDVHRCEFHCGEADMLEWLRTKKGWTLGPSAEPGDKFLASTDTDGRWRVPLREALAYLVVELGNG